MEQTQKDTYKSSRILYIIEAALEYFISILVTGTFLAKITNAIGISDSLTGILSAFVSLGSGFQIFAIFLANKYPVKRWVTPLHIINQLAFSFIYLCPFFKMDLESKILLFIIFLLVGHIINNVINPSKINWYMSLVDNSKRGSYTAKKEMVSLIFGMIFTLIMGALIDKFEAQGNINTAFVICAICLFSLMIFHSLTLVFSREKPIEEIEIIHKKHAFKESIKDKRIYKITIVSLLWCIANNISTPFYGSYQIKELGFSMTFVSIIAIIYAVTRSIFSMPIGRYADKHSFAKMLNICFVIMLFAFGIIVFTVPSNGKIFYIIYVILNSIAMAGINSSTINLIYDYIDEEKRTSALAFKSAIVGFSGFLTTLSISPLVTYIQKNGNTFLGFNVYAQQVLSAISLVIVIILLIYLNAVVVKMSTTKEKI